MWEDFKKFALKGNVMDMAVGVIVGGAFGKIVTSLVNDVIMPLLGLVLGRIDLSSLKLILRHGNDTTAELALTYGAFLQNILDSDYLFQHLMAIRLITNLRKKEEQAPPAPAAPPEPSAEEKLLAEIRDLLKQQSGERSA